MPKGCSWWEHPCTVNCLILLKSWGGGVTRYKLGCCECILLQSEKTEAVQTCYQSVSAYLQRWQGETRPKERRVHLVEISLREYSNALSLDLAYFYHDKWGLPPCSSLCAQRYIFLFNPAIDCPFLAKMFSLSSNISSWR